MSDLSGDEICGSVRVVEHDGQDGVVMRFLGCNGTSIGAAFVEPAHARGQIVYTAMIVQAAAALIRVSRGASQRSQPESTLGWPVADEVTDGWLSPRRVLCLGLGAGAVPTALRVRHGLHVDVVERSAAVLAMASAYFGFSAGTGVHGQAVLADARELLRAAEGEGEGMLRGRYDVVIVDLFDGSSTRTEGRSESSAHAAAGGQCEDTDDPGVAAIKRRWLQRGHGQGGLAVLVLNVVAAIGERAGAMGAPAERAAAELARTFEHVRAFADHAPTATELGAAEACNVIFFASDRPFRFDKPAALLRAAAAAQADGRGEDGEEAGDEGWVLGAFDPRWELPALGSAAGWAHRTPPTAAQAREGAVLAAASMAAVQARSLPAGVLALLAGADGATVR